MTATSCDVMVLGAGAVGTAVALTLQRKGCATLLVGRRPPTNASLVAAGMIAPVLEAWTDPAARDSLPLLAAGADLWPGFAATSGVILRQPGGVWLSEAAASALAVVLGRTVRSLDAVALAQVAPAVTGWPGPAVWVSGEGSVDPRQALAAMHDGFLAAGGRHVDGVATPDGDGWHVAGQPVRAGQVILASGFPAPDLATAAPELTRLIPIRGQILRVAAGLDPMSPCVRGPGAYVAPLLDGDAMVGATMEPGEAGPVNDPQTVAALLQAASAFMPSLADRPWTAQAGIRAAAPDHLPMIGPSQRPGVWLATGLRRNGWLLAPLAASLIEAYLASNDPGPLACALDPRRFDAPT